MVPRFAGPATFARLPRLDEVERADIAVLGVPFDAGTSYRPGARFGPAHIRAASKLLRTYNPVLDVEPFGVQQVVDAGDVTCNPFDIADAVMQIDEGARIVLDRSDKLVTIGGDHTIALPLLRVIPAVRRGRGDPFRCPPGHLEHLLQGPDHPRDCVPACVRGRSGRQDGQHPRRYPRVALRRRTSTTTSSRLPVVGAHDMDAWARTATTSDPARVGDRPAYVSVDIDVLDPAFAPGTGTPEAGGMTSRELLAVLRGFSTFNLVGADIVEVAPAYDHAEITGIAAAHAAYELVAPRPAAGRPMAEPVTGGAAVVDALVAHGVRHVFGIPGTHNLKIYRYLPDSGVRHVVTRHEQGAGYAADGYARVTGRPGVLVTTSGPGITNAITALATAYADSVPLLAVSPGPPRGQERADVGWLHEVKDQQAALDAVTARSIRVEAADEVPETVAEVFEGFAASRPRPVHLEVPVDVLEGEWVRRPVPVGRQPGQSGAPHPDGERIATLLAAASHPLLVAGGGARGATDEIRALAEQGVRCSPPSTARACSTSRIRRPWEQASGSRRTSGDERSRPTGRGRLGAG